ncbi:hypothetical protein OGAPHI_001318 [Ogataea philodendri]|uniref:Integrase catalytic domain-containing protein n=1 Tax=Ogataea philodendri TaxID=1378263 RepID=A0A9P8PEZ5_9ASCO|nr:uncharacterized protein OGAPHI_001318 [Ogataea philodendri]KAH3670802.1 hypothetical protein OGAPHI_001318 [Ogataea philodendri]
MVSSDVCDIKVTPGTFEYKRFISFRCSYTSYTVVYPLDLKTLVYTKIDDVIHWVHNQGYNIFEFFSDQGLEYRNSKDDPILQQHGIDQILTSGFTPASNGVAERLNLTILYDCRAMLVGGRLPNFFWPEAVQSLEQSLSSLTAHPTLTDEPSIGLGISNLCQLRFSTIIITSRNLDLLVILSNLTLKYDLQTREPRNIIGTPRLEPVSSSPIHISPSNNDTDTDHPSKGATSQEGGATVESPEIHPHDHVFGPEQDKESTESNDQSSVTHGPRSSVITFPEHSSTSSRDGTTSLSAHSSSLSSLESEPVIVIRPTSPIPELQIDPSSDTKDQSSPDQNLPEESRFAVKRPVEIAELPNETVVVKYQRSMPIRRTDRVLRSASKQANLLYVQNHYRDTLRASDASKWEEVYPSLFILQYTEGRTSCLLGLFVDDLIFCATENEVLDDLIVKLKDRYELRIIVPDEEGKQNFLGMELEIMRNDTGNIKAISISQSQYIEDIVSTYDVKTSKVLQTPIYPQFYHLPVKDAIFYLIVK